jgi:hypothetical protein
MDDRSVSLCAYRNNKLPTTANSGGELQILVDSIPSLVACEGLWPELGEQRPHRKCIQELGFLSLQHNNSAHFSSIH